MTQPTEDLIVPAPPNPKVNTEKRFFTAICIAFAFAIVLPYLWVWAITPPNMVWGGLIGETFDSNVHLAWARQARDGNFFFRDLFTTEGLISGEKPLFFNVLPMLWGWLAKTGIPLIFWFHLTRVVAGVWALWEFIKLARHILPNSSQRVIALYLVGLTTGASFLAVALPQTFGGITFIDHPNPSNNFPPMPEAFVFTSAFLFPLNIVSYGLMAFLFRNVIESEDVANKKALGLSFLGALALANIHTYDAIPLGLTLLGWMVWCIVKKQPRSAKLCLAILVGLAIPTLYQGLVFRGSEEFRVKALTPTTAPPFQYIAWSFFPLFLLFVVGLTQLRKSRGMALMATWAVITFICIYLPVSFARKMIEGGHMPLALIAGAGLATVLSLLPSPIIRRAIGVGLLATLSVSPLYFVKWDLDNAAENNQSRFQAMMPGIYINEADWQALRFLDQQKSKNGAVLSTPHLGAYGPRETGMTFYLSHWAETLYFEKKIGVALRFYGARMTPDEANKFLKDNRIQYVVETYAERLFAQNSGYAASYGLVPVWTQSIGDAQTVIYAPTGTDTE